MRATPARALLLAGCAFALVATSGCAEEDETNVDLTDTPAVVDDPAYDDPAYDNNAVGTAAGDSVDIDGDGDFDEVREAADEASDAVRGAADAAADAASDAAGATEDAAREVADEIDDAVTGD